MNKDKIKKNNENEEVYKAQSNAIVVIKRLFKNKLAVMGLFVLIFLLFMAFFGEALAPYDPTLINFREKFATPNSAHPFGCDDFGRDILSRMMAGTKYSLAVGFGAVFFALIAGVIIGSCAGYFGGQVDNLLMRLMDVIQSVPGMLMSICVSAVLGTGFGKTILALSITTIPNFARILRASIMQIRKMEYLEASEAINCSTFRLVMKHLLPNAFSSLLVTATLNVAGAISQAAGLSFIGLGVQPPTPEWGAILSSSRAYMRDFPHMVIFPGLVLAITNFSLNLLGDGFRDALDPKLKR